MVLLPVYHQAIIWTSTGLLSFNSLGINLSEILIKIHNSVLMSWRWCCIHTIISINYPMRKLRWFLPQSSIESLVAVKPVDGMVCHNLMLCRVLSTYNNNLGYKAHYGLIIIHYGLPIPQLIRQTVECFIEYFSLKRPCFKEVCLCVRLVPWYWM